MRRAFLILFGFIAALPLFAEGREATLRDGARIHYEDDGAGEVVLLLHGHTLDRRMWEQQVEVLKDSFRVLVPDFRGYGLSSDPVEGVQFTYADDIMELLDTLGIAKVHAVGLSMGAYVAGDLLAIFPKRLSSCVMVAGEICNRPGPTSPKTKEAKANQRAGNAQLLRNGVQAYKRSRVEQLVQRAGSHGEEIRRPLEAMIMEWGAWQVSHVTSRVYYGKDAWERLKKTKPDVPSLIIYGEKEGAGRSRMLDCLPNARQLSFPDCGHMVNMEQPGMFNETLLKWLRTHKADANRHGQQD